MKKLITLALLLSYASLFAATQNIIQDTKTHKIIKPAPSTSAAFDLDFSDVTTNISGGGTGTGTPGGANLQLQFNNAFAFGGVPYATYDGTTVQFRTGARFTWADLVDPTKQVQINLGAFSGGILRTISPASAGDSVTVVPGGPVGSASSNPNTFVVGIGTDGTLRFGQPSFANLSGTLTLAQTSMSSNKILGRGSTSTGPIEEITLGTNLSLTGTTLNATGGGGTPGGSPAQLQFNSSGVFGGVPGITSDGITAFIKGGAFTRLQDNSDPTKMVSLNLSNVPTGSTVSLTVAGSNSTTVIPDAGTANQFLTALSGTGVLSKAQPSFANLSGTISLGQNNLPITGEIWVDGTAGSDTIGVRGNLARPFKTVAAACAAANAGDVVYIGPGTFAQGGAPLALPAGVTVVGVGADYTLITSTVASATNRASVEPGTSSAIYGVTIQNTAPTGIPFGVGSGSAAFTAAYMGGCKIIGNSDGISLNKTGTTGLAVENVNVRSQSSTFYSAQGGSFTFRNCDFFSDGTPSSIAVNINVLNGSVLFRDGALTAINSTGTNVAVNASGASSSVELHNVAITRNTTGATNVDLAQASSATISKDLVGRTDGTALSNLGTITDLLSTYPGNINVTAASKLLGRGSAAGAGAAQEITLGTGLSMTGTTLNGTSTSTPGGSNTQVQFNDSGAFGGDAGLTYNKTTDALTIGGALNVGGGTMNVSTGYQVGGTAASGTVLRGDGTKYAASAYTMAAPGTTGNVLTSDGTNWLSSAPAAGGAVSSVSGTSPILSTPTTGAVVVSLDPNVDFVLSNTQTVRANNPATNTVTDIFTLGHNTSGTPANGLGTGIIFQGETSTLTNRDMAEISTVWSDVTQATRTAYLDFQLVNSGAVLASKMRLFPSGGLSLNNTTDPGAGIMAANTGYWVGAAASASGKILKSDGAAFKPSTETYAAPGTSGNVLTSDGTNWISSTPAAGGVSSVTGTSPVTATPTTGAVVLGLNTGVDFIFTAPQTDRVNDATANDFTNVLDLVHNTTGTPANGLGTAILFEGESDTATNRSMGRIGTAWSDVADATRAPYMSFQLVNAGTGTLTNKMRLWTSGGLSLGNVTDPAAAIVSAQAGFRSGTAVPASGKILKSDGTSYVGSTETYAAPGTSGNVMVSDGTNWTSSLTVGALTFGGGVVNAGTGFQIGGAAASGKILQGNGTNYVASTMTWPSGSAPTSGKILQSNGTNIVATTETYAAPGTTRNIMQSDGTNWTSAVPPVMTLSAKNITLLTTGTPADLTSITVPASVTRYRIVGTTAVNAFHCIVTETQAGTPAAGLCQAQTAASGGGTTIMASQAPSAGANTIATWPSSSASALLTNSTIYIRQTANSANTATLSFYIMIQPLP